MTLVWISPLALLVGLVLGALGGGGAILTVPILVYVVGLGPKAATTGSLIIVGLSALVGLVPHARAGKVRHRDGLIFGALGVVGSLAGTRLNALVPPEVLMTALAVLMLIVAGLMTRKGRQANESGACDCGERRGLPALLVAATVVGLLTGFFGVGGGFAVVPALVLTLGFSMPLAVGTSLLVIVVNSLTALGARVGGGLEVDWPLILTLGVIASVGSVLGGRAAQRVEAAKLNLAFTILLVLVAGFIAAQNVPRLFA